MKLGFVSAILPDLSLEEVLRFAAGTGYDCVELMCWPPSKAERRYAGVTHVDVTEFSDKDAGNVREMAGAAGVVARFFPPGHSSSVKIMGQFSIPIRTLRSPANSTRGLQVSRKRGQLSLTESAGSLPTNVVMRWMPKRAEASMTFLMWSV